MAFLLRQAKRSAWTGEEEVTAERREAALASFARRDVDTDGVSIFAVPDEAGSLLIVAAFACLRMSDGSIDLLRLEEDEVASFGTVTKVDGDTPLRSANELHRTLNWADEALQGLVQVLLTKRREATRYSSKQVRAAVLSIGAEDLMPGDHQDWVETVRRRASVVPTGP